jgi:GNAT superfamily N-acetyltransferase
MALTFQQEDVSIFIEDCMDLIIEHWKDVALNQDSTPLDPDWDRYTKLAAAGILHITSARTEDGELVGYAVCLITPHLRYKSVKWAEGDVFYLQPAHRKGSAGTRLMQAAEDAMRAHGVTKIIQKVKIHNDVGAVFERMGYKAIERVFVKELS